MISDPYFSATAAAAAVALVEFSEPSTATSIRLKFAPFAPLILGEISLVATNDDLSAYSARSISRVHLVAIPAITPMAASQGAKASIATAPVTPQVRGKERRVFPISSLMITLFTLASLTTSLNFSTSFSEETWKVSFLRPSWLPHERQNLALAGSSVPQSRHFAIALSGESGIYPCIIRNCVHNFNMPSTTPSILLDPVSL